MLKQRKFKKDAKEPPTLRKGQENVLNQDFYPQTKPSQPQFFDSALYDTLKCPWTILLEH